MKVVSYNIRYGLGLDQRFDLDRIANAVHGADIIAFQEVERFWRRSGMVDQPEILGQLLDKYYWVYCPAFDADASSHDKLGQLLNRRRQFGPMLMSKWPILSARHILLPKLKTHTQFNMSTGAIDAVISTSIGPVRVYSLHLSSISTRERLLQIDFLLEDYKHSYQHGAICSGGGFSDNPAENENFIKQDWQNADPLPPQPKHTLFMGDFNSVEDSAEYIRFAGEVDPIYGRGMHCDDLLDSWCIAKDTVGDSITWRPDPPDRPPGHGLRLDYCFTSTSLRSAVTRAWIDSNASGSDHYPYWVEISVNQ